MYEDYYGLSEKPFSLTPDPKYLYRGQSHGNAFDLLRDWSSEGPAYDTIVLDPPAFAKSNRAVEGALRGYKELHLRAMKLLRPGGELITCS